MWANLLYGIVAVGHWCSDLIANHQAVSVLAFGAAIVTMPEEPIFPFIPKGPWKWVRDAGQAFWNSRNPNLPPSNHPTQPVPPAPEQPKQTA
jgi:hypothetical protein